MKPFFVLLLLLSFSFSYAQDSKVKWLTDFDNAKEVASKENKPILLYFTGSDWCGPCKRLKADFFKSDKLIKMTNNFVFVKADLPRSRDIITDNQRKANIKLSAIYNKRGGVPLLVALDYDGNVIEQISGYSMLRETDMHFAFVERVAKSYK